MHTWNNGLESASLPADLCMLHNSHNLPRRLVPRARRLYLASDVPGSSRWTIATASCEHRYYPLPSWQSRQHPDSRYHSYFAEAACCMLPWLFIRYRAPTTSTLTTPHHSSGTAALTVNHSIAGSIRSLTSRLLFSHRNHVLNVCSPPITSKYLTLRQNHTSGRQRRDLHEA